MYLSNHISQKNKMKKGFTLIELLVVIGILGILAAGLLAAIDPLEQLKKGRDTQKRNTAVEINNAATRYYAVYGSMPTTLGAAATVTAGGTYAWIDTLVSSGELKPNFTRGLPAGASNQLLVTMNSSAVVVCFDPESRSISGDPSTIFTAVAIPPSASSGSCSPTGTCMFCVQ